MNKSDSVSPFREGEAAGDGRAGESDAAWVESWQPPTDAAVVLRASRARSAQNGASSVDLSDVNNARSLAVLSVSPHSRVLDVGSGPGAVACALTARGCRVWGIDIDSGATRLAAPWCEAILHGDVETADLHLLLGSQRVDAVLFLDVLEHLRDPAAAIRRVLPFLAPGGKVILSVRHVAHAAVRLQLLAGASAPTWDGLLDRTHLHVFDRASLHELLQHAGVRVIDEVRVVRSVEGSGIPLKLAAVPRAVYERATSGLDAETYQFFVIAAPGAVDSAIERPPTLLGTLTERLHRIERQGRRLERLAKELGKQLESQRCEHDRLREALEEIRDGQRRLSEAAASEDFQRSALEQSEEQLARTTDELVRCRLERQFLRDDVLVKDAYLATLRQQVAGREQSHADIRALTERLDGLGAEHAAEMKRAEVLASSNHEIRQQIEQAQHELRRVHALFAETLAQPRYVLADRCNAWAKKAGLLHRGVKRVWAAWYRDR